MTIIHGDCLDVLKTLADNSVDAVVTDPPYGLSFMGKKWDYDVPSVEIWAECLRVLKPGGHLLAFAGTRTQHRMAVRIEDAGFEIRDMIAWVYGSGFPKSHNVSIAIDKINGLPHRGKALVVAGRGERKDIQGKDANPKPQDIEPYAPATEAARQWQGWGTALKPALEPITVARKPLIGTVAENVLAHGTGGMNIDGCRVEGAIEGDPLRFQKTNGGDFVARFNDAPVVRSEGRWPANLIHDGGEPAELLGDAARFFKTSQLEDSEWLAQNLRLYDALIVPQSLSPQSLADAIAQSDAATLALPEGTALSVLKVHSTSATLSELKNLAEPVIKAIQNIGPKFLQEWQRLRLSPLDSPVSVVAQREQTGIMTITVSHWKSDGSAEPVIFSITPKSAEHGALGSRFRYCAKASKRDRDEGLDGFATASRGALNMRNDSHAERNGNTPEPRANTHPTVKPTDLMRYLCRLVTPPNGIVLDPFTGSGSTGKAAVLEGFQFIGIEREAEYVEIAKARIAVAKPCDEQAELF